MSWLYLSIAIFFEIIGTSALKAADGFTRPIPTMVTIGCYVITFFFFSLALRTIPMGIAYAVWSGIGIVAISLVGLILYRQSLDAAAIVGIGLILAGTVVIHLFSKGASH